MNPLIRIKEATSLFLVALVLTCFALSPAAHARQPTPVGANLWYVPGIDENYPVGISNTSVYCLMNPGTQAGAVTLTLRDGDGNDVCSVSGTAAPMGQVTLFSFACNVAHQSFLGYAVISSDVPILVYANETDGVGNRSLVAYPVSQ